MQKKETMKMNIFKWKTNKIFEEIPELIIPAVNGIPSFIYPGEVSESMRQLISRLNKKGGLPKSLAMMAALRQEGVSYLSQALGATIANDLGQRVCLVELNYWWPTPVFQFEGDERSLAAVIDKRMKLSKAVISTGWPNFNILPAGEIARHNRPKVANSEEIREIIKELEDLYDHLILDIPAILATTDAVALASLGSSACLVIHQGITPVEDVNQALDEVEHLNIAGVALNRSKFASPKQIIRVIA
jgi:Mrp family chromosome partitioning ATPase